MSDNSYNYDLKFELFQNQQALEKNIGIIVACGDGIARVSGLSGVKTNELVIINDSIPALAMNLENNQIGIVLFGADYLIGQGDIVERSFSVISVPLTTNVCGRIIDSLGNVVDGVGSIEFSETEKLMNESYLPVMDIEVDNEDPNEGEEDEAEVEIDTIEDSIDVEFEEDEEDEEYEEDKEEFDNETTDLDDEELNYTQSKNSNNITYSNIDQLIQFLTVQTSEIDVKAAGIIQRRPVAEPVYTGVKIVDSIIPIGKGQRELIIGDRQTGKTAIAIDAVINQANLLQKSIGFGGAVCIYASIGQKRSTVSQISQKLKRFNAINGTVIVAATASDTAAMQFLAPYTACTIAEYFNTKYLIDALVIYDDLSKQAVAYRQVSLLLRRPPGREAYPGDIFYLHSRLLERAVKLKTGASITALPVVETLEGDVSAFIPTNVISITDGQVFLEKELVNRGIMPAINVGLSVSRVGSNAQLPVIKSIAGQLKLKLAQFREVEAFLTFSGDLDPTTLHTLNQGVRLVEILKQGQYAQIAPKTLIL